MSSSLLPLEVRRRVTGSVLNLGTQFWMTLNGTPKWVRLFEGSRSGGTQICVPFLWSWNPSRFSFVGGGPNPGGQNKRRRASPKSSQSKVMGLRSSPRATSRSTSLQGGSTHRLVCYETTGPRTSFPRLFWSRISGLEVLRGWCPIYPQETGKGSRTTLSLLTLIEE